MRPGLSELSAEDRGGKSVVVVVTQDLPGLNGEWEFPSWPGSVPQGSSGLPSGEGQHLGREACPTGALTPSQGLCRPKAGVLGKVAGDRAKV